MSPDDGHVAIFVMGSMVSTDRWNGLHIHCDFNQRCVEIEIIPVLGCRDMGFGHKMEHITLRMNSDTHMK